MPPWEWRRAQAAKAAAQRTLTTKRASGGLRNEDLKASGRKAVGSRIIGKPTAKPLNTPGLDADLNPYLTQGRISIVYFYADWCPAFRVFDKNGNLAAEGQNARTWLSQRQKHSSFCGRSMATDV